jgi:predicted nucleotidyltransferase
MDQNILSIILYGSHARKEHDAASDFDICVFTRERTSEELKIEDIAEVVHSLQPANINLVTYPDSAVSAMLSHGSLFLWHLKLEGKVLYGEQYFTNKLRKLARFKTHYDDIKYHNELFNDLKRSWNFLSIVNELDLSLLFTIVRNTCMVLAHKQGRPTFGRLSSYHAAKEALPSMPLTIDLYTYLSQWKILYERQSGKTIKLPTADAFMKILSDTENFLQYALLKTSQNA